MYGTISRMKTKPGSADKLMAMQSEFEGNDVPGFHGVLVYRMDDDPNSFMMAVVFDSRESYLANASSPEQNARYEAFTALLEGPPDWHDGEIVYSSVGG